MSPVNQNAYLRAEVKNIKLPQCPVETRILVDANVLYFCYYDRCGQLDYIGKSPEEYQMIEYQLFLKKLLESKSNLFIDKIGLLEFLKSVEHVELKLLYLKKNKVSEIGKDFKLKAMRNNYPEEYRAIKGRIATYLNSIRKNFRLLNSDISLGKLMEDTLIEWQDSFTDPGDAMMVKEAKRHGVTSVLSDDADFATFSDIKLYTANYKAIRLYRKKTKNPTKH